jgi:hypothetical protein
MGWTACASGIFFRHSLRSSLFASLESRQTSESKRISHLYMHRACIRIAELGVRHGSKDPRDFLTKPVSREPAATCVVFQMNDFSHRRVSWWLLGTILTCFLPTSMRAQVLGQDLCACQPASIEMRLQLNLTCGDRDITEALPGVIDSACLVQPRTPAGEPVVNVEPTMVREILILELDQNQEVVSQTLFNEGYEDGSVVKFSSTVAQDPNSIDLVTLPSGLAVTITGINSDGQPLLNTWAIRYNNDCSIYPIIRPGQKIGWTVFVSIHISDDIRIFFRCYTNLCHWSTMPQASTVGPPPSFDLCPADNSTAAPAISPTRLPIQAPTGVPVMLPAAAPTGSPVMVPVVPTTKSPIRSPLVAPSPEPSTTKPIIAPAPTPSKSRAPIPRPSSAPFCPPIRSTVSPVNSGGSGQVGSDSSKGGGSNLVGEPDKPTKKRKRPPSGSMKRIKSTKPSVVDKDRLPKKKRQSSKAMQRIAEKSNRRLKVGPHPATFEPSQFPTSCSEPDL